MIDIIRYPLVTQVEEDKVYWLFKLKAVPKSGNMPHKIFVHHAAMNDDRYEGDIFEAICSVQQLEDLPDDVAMESVEGQVLPYYRSDMMACLVESLEEADDLWECIKEDVSELVDQFGGTTEFFNQAL